MKVCFSSKIPLCLLSAGLILGAAPSLLAQQAAGQMNGPSKYLFLTNVDLKPEQGNAYQKIESDEIQAMRAANAPSHYLGMGSITGANHVIFLHGFDSFADLQKDHDATVAMSKLMDTLKADGASEAPLIADRHTSIYEYKEDLSEHVNLDLSKMRFMRVTLFHVRSGHDQDWEHVVKLYMKAYDSTPEAHWAMFEKMYGVGSDNIYILVTPMASLSEVDAMRANNKKFEESTGADQLQVLRNGLTTAVESSETDLFALSPKLSYAPDAWVSASPDFWGRK